MHFCSQIIAADQGECRSINVEAGAAFSELGLCTILVSIDNPSESDDKSETDDDAEPQQQQTQPPVTQPDDNGDRCEVLPCCDYVLSTG